MGFKQTSFCFSEISLHRDYHVENRLDGTRLKADAQAGGGCSICGEKMMAAWIKMEAVYREGREILDVFWHFTITSTQQS